MFSLADPLYSVVSHSTPVITGIVSKSSFLWCSRRTIRRITTSPQSPSMKASQPIAPCSTSRPVFQKPVEELWSRSLFRAGMSSTQGRMFLFIPRFCLFYQRPKVNGRATTTIRATAKMTKPPFLHVFGGFLGHARRTVKHTHNILYLHV